jgi:hypothetical protein
MEAGYQTVQWNGQNVGGRAVASGIYLYRVQAGSFTTARKMLLIK